MVEPDWSNFMRRCDVFNELGNCIGFLWLRHSPFCRSDLQKARWAKRWISKFSDFFLIFSWRGYITHHYLKQWIAFGFGCVKESIIYIDRWVVSETQALFSCFLHKFQIIIECLYICLRSKLGNVNTSAALLWCIECFGKVGSYERAREKLPSANIVSYGWVIT